jgi:hypothetical protein
MGRSYQIAAMGRSYQSAAMGRSYQSAALGRSCMPGGLFTQGQGRGQPARPLCSAASPQPREA